MTRLPVRRAAFAASALATAGTVLGRAGGGDHSAPVPSFSVGHSGHSGGGSLGELIALVLVALIIRAIYRRITRNMSKSQTPAAMPLAQAALAALGAAAGGRLGGGTAAAGAAPNPDLAAAVEGIRGQDPGFELETFLQRAEMTFFLVKRGIQHNDAAAIRPYVNDALFAEQSRTLGQSKAQHNHSLLESLNVRAMHLLSAQCDAQSQRLQIHFDLVYRAKTVGDTNQILADEGEDRRHAERWTFARSATARTPVAGGVTASRCPACGAELQLSLDGTCAHCRASVTNGTVDWVVADIQSAEFVGYSSDSSFAAAAPTIADGLVTLRAADPSFVLEAFQARVKTAFLTLQEAWCQQHLDAGRAFLSPGAYFTWRAQLETLAAEGRRNVMENIEVRSVEPVQIVHGRVFDDLTVRIAASAVDYDIDKDGKVVFGDHTSRPFTEDWTFQRSVGVATLAKPGTLENTCPSCGAPVSLNQVGECRFCKAAVTSGKFDWVVSRIEQDDAITSNDSAIGNVGEDLALQVGGAIVGGLLGSLLSGRGADDSRK